MAAVAAISSPATTATRQKQQPPFPQPSRTIAAPLPATTDHAAAMKQVLLPHVAAMERVLLPHAAAMATPVLNPPLTQNHRLLSLPRSHRNNSHGNSHTIRRDHLLRQPPPRAPATIIRVPAASTNLCHLHLNHRAPAATNLHLHAGERISIAASPSLQQPVRTCTTTSHQCLHLHLHEPVSFTYLSSPENAAEPPWKHLQESRSRHANATAAKSPEQPPRRSSRAITREGEECESETLILESALCAMCQHLIGSQLVKLWSTGQTLVNWSNSGQILVNFVKMLK